MKKTKSLSFFKLSSDAFTLIELLVVVLIIGILAAIAVPQYQKSVIKSRSAEAITMLKNISDAANRYYLQNGTYLGMTYDALDIDIPAKRSGDSGYSVNNFGANGPYRDTQNFRFILDALTETTAQVVSQSITSDGSLPRDSDSSGKDYNLAYELTNGQTTGRLFYSISSPKYCPTITGTTCEAGHSGYNYF